jgi:CheY-like chemotaxis protein
MDTRRELKTMAAVDLRQLVHDLRNRIAPIRNVLYLMRLRGGQDQKLTDAIAIIERQIEGMGKLLDEVTAAAQAAVESPPVPEPAGAAASINPRGAGEASGRKILIADDSPAVCESFAAIVRDLGHEVRAAHDGQEAVDIATAWVPDFVLLDVNMPKLNGYEAARRLRAQFPSSPQSPSPVRLVMISGADIDSGVLEAARQAGFDQCLDTLLDFAALRKMLGE